MTDIHHVISASYGNDSVAMIQWAHETGLEDVTVVYCDTGWAAPGWDKRVEQGERLAKYYGFATVRLQSLGMEELVRMKKGWPGNAQQFCTMHLKGIPFLQWLDDADPEYRATVLVGKRRTESRARAATPEFIHDSEYHGCRTLWHPLYQHSDQERDQLVRRSGLPLLPHRSQECSPCVNANRSDFLLLTPEQIERVNTLEVEVGKPMYRPKRFQTMGIFGVIAWAKHGTADKRLEAETDFFGGGCDGAYGCGL